MTSSPLNTIQMSRGCGFLAAWLEKAQQLIAAGYSDNNNSEVSKELLVTEFHG
jgi:hypothetical protein